VKKLIGRTDMEDGLKRLDRLTNEEHRMASAQNLKVTHAVDNRVKVVVDQVAGVDDRVAGVSNQVEAVDDKVAIVTNQVEVVDDRVAGVSNQVEAVDDRVASVSNQVEAVDNRVNQMQRSSSLKPYQCSLSSFTYLTERQSSESLHRWLSPSDPSTNHNIARDTENKTPASWFFQGTIFKDWHSAGSLLWIHGKRVPLFHFISLTSY
jgi:archaellum component FlaC